MLRNRKIIGGIIAFLILANIIYYLSGWGLITVKVTDAPLSKVIKSIEWQGWVKIYSNIDPEAKVTMYVDHVPLAEAMDTLALNIDMPSGGGGPPPGALGAGTPPGGPGGGAPPGGGRGGGGFGRGAQWNLAFFVAPSSGDVKAEIRSFTDGSADDNAKIFNHPTPLQMLATDDEMPSADPRFQTWPGMKASTAPAPPTPPPTGNAVAADPIDPNSLQAYLEAFAQAANIWIMAPSSWNPPVSSAPAPNSSISSAVQGLVGHANGTVVQAIILRSGRGGRGLGGGPFAGGDAGWTDMTERMANAINGLPPEARADAQAQLQQEISFRKDVQSAPPDQQRDMMRKHMMEKIANNDNNWRRSPEKRAQRYQRMVANRMAAQGKK